MNTRRALAFGFCSVALDVRANRSRTEGARGTSFASIADVTKPAEQAKAFGLIGPGRALARGAPDPDDRPTGAAGM